MPALRNDPDCCEVMNLAWGPDKHGPYLVRQEGYPPGATDFTPQRFILRKDGCWLLNLAFVMLTDSEQEAQLFHSLKEVLIFLDELSSRPMRADTSLPEGVTAQEIMTHFERCTRRILSGMRNCEVKPCRN